MGKLTVENNIDVSVDQSVSTNAKAEANVTLATEPISVETSFDTTVDITFPQFRGGTSGFNLELFGIPIFFLEPFYIGTERADEFFGELFFGGEFSRTPSYRITEKCIGCSTCARQCPTGAIYGVAKRRFFVNPYQCILCGTCGRACPVTAIVDNEGEPVKRVKPKEKKEPVVDEDLCSGCENCVNICPFNCLSIKPDKAVETIKGVSYLEKKPKCVACGECERICAQEAIKLKDPEPEPAKQVA